MSKRGAGTEGYFWKKLYKSTSNNFCPFLITDIFLREPVLSTPPAIDPDETKLIKLFAALFDEFDWLNDVSSAAAKIETEW